MFSVRVHNLCRDEDVAIPLDVGVVYKRIK